MLVAYTLLLLHSLIPHCHTNEHGHTVVLQENKSDQHNHHHHNFKQSDNHHHGSHTDLSGHDTFDLLICFLEETEHTATGIDYSLYHHSETRTSFVNTLSGANDFALAVSCYNADIAKEEQTDLSYTEALDYQSPPRSLQPARGPPIFS